MLFIHNRMRRDRIGAIGWLAGNVKRDYVLVEISAIG
jgi:hypothetical protein